MTKLKDYNFVIQPKLIPLTKAYKKWQTIRNTYSSQCKEKVIRTTVLREKRVYVSVDYFVLDNDITHMCITPDKGIRINGMYFRHGFITQNPFHLNPFYNNLKSPHSLNGAEKYLNITDHFEGTTKELREYLNECENSQSV